VNDRLRTALRLPATAAVLALSMGLAALAAQQAAPAAAAKEPTPAQKYKNVTVLKDLGDAEFHDSMVYMGAATGLSCDGCHVRTPQGEWQWEKDDKDHKTAARTMITMTNAINAQHFKGEPRVTCTTCHNGRREPLPTTPLAQVLTADQIAMQKARAAGGPRPAPPTEKPEDILDKYVTALGGRDALAKVTSRAMKGTTTTRDGGSHTFSIQENAAGAYRADTEMAPGFVVTAVFDGEGAWIKAGPDGGDVEGVIRTTLARSGELGLALKAKEALSRLAIGRYERIDGQDVISVNGRSTPDVAETWHFDRTSGLLVRRVVRMGTVMGPVSMQLDFSDYRTVDGVKVPFTIRQTTWEDVRTATFTDVRLNGVAAGAFSK
jgi:hypothetical protein